jgi:phosphoglycolate phosphatase
MTVLFDLDGTLVDSAPDMAAAGNAMRVASGMPPLALSDYRPHCGSGARGVIGVAFGVSPQDPAFNSLRDDFFERYRHCLAQQTRVFDAILPVLSGLECRGRPWGVVTNKALRFAEPLLAHLNLLGRCAVLVGGDSTPFTKPHPQPLLEAARRLGVEPAACIYIGDDLRDVAAGRAAGMTTCAAGWGYLGPHAAVGQWGADHIAAHPGELLQLLDLP